MGLVLSLSLTLSLTLLILKWFSTSCLVIQNANDCYRFTRHSCCIFVLYCSYCEANDLQPALVFIIAACRPVKMAGMKNYTLISVLKCKRSLTEKCPPSDIDDVAV